MEKVHRSKERVDLFSLNIDLGNVEWTPCPPPEGLEFEAFLSDPQFEDVRSYQLGTVRGTGVFFQGLAMRRMFCIHQDVVRGLYRVDNFLLKRNYFVSAVVQEKAPTSETKEWVQSASHPISKSPDRSPAAALAEGMHSADKEDLTFNTNQGVSWADMDEGWEESQFTNPYDPFFDEKKQMNDMKFMNPSFLDSLIKMRQHFVPASEFVRKNPGFAKRTFYLFDYVAMFIDLRDVFENRGDFNSSFIQKRLELLDEIENSVGVLAPLQHAENKDWSSSVKFLCQILNGELQVSFLRVTLYFSMRKVGTRERILSSERLSEATKKFLTGDKSNRRDFAKTTRLNLSALANNKKILLDEDYAMNHLSRVHDE